MRGREGAQERRREVKGYEVGGWRKGEGKEEGGGVEGCEKEGRRVSRTGLKKGGGAKWREGRVSKR